MFIVIDGLDGSGKSSVAAKLLNSLPDAEALEFPRYKNKSSALVKMYLGGEITADPKDITPYAAASMFALDRYISFKTGDWATTNEKLYISDRYVSSNIIYQMTKLPPREREAFALWLYDFEFNKLGLPKPDLTIYLDQLPSLSQKFLEQRYKLSGGAKDIHESDTEFLTHCRTEILKILPTLGWTKIECFEGETPKTLKQITAEVRAELEKCLNSEPLN
ncbi:MAG: thymidylate kinase [Ruminococcus sp.]|jgi:dTMP kinase|nr:thymidylate kinase [Ruminococcus sp.]